MPFSGIIEELGTVVALTADQEMTLWDGSQSKGTVLKISAKIVSKISLLIHVLSCRSLCRPSGIATSVRASQFSGHASPSLSLTTSPSPSMWRQNREHDFLLPLLGSFAQNAQCIDAICLVFFRLRCTCLGDLKVGYSGPFVGLGSS